MMSSEPFMAFLRSVAPVVEQALQENETVNIFEVTKALPCCFPHIRRKSELHQRLVEDR